MADPTHGHCPPLRSRTDWRGERHYRRLVGPPRRRFRGQPVRHRRDKEDRADLEKRGFRGRRSVDRHAERPAIAEIENREKYGSKIERRGEPRALSRHLFRLTPWKLRFSPPSV